MRSLLFVPADSPKKLEDVYKRQAYGRGMFNRGIKQFWRPLIGVVVAYAVAAQSLLICLLYTSRCV